MMNEHLGSRDTYDFIADWISPNFFYSKKDVWHRFGMVGVFGDYVLSATPGDILEIGVGESSIYLTGISKKYHRRIYHCDIQPGKIINPLTIPGYLSDDYTYLEPKDEVPQTLARCVCYAGSSDDLFTKIPITPLALSFIDGDHQYEQAKKDFWNIWNYTVEHGYILLHDTMPPSDDYLDENHCGGVWKLRKELEADDRMDVLTLTKGCAINVGLTIVRKLPTVRAAYQ